MTAINYNKLRLNTDSPFLKDAYPNPLKGGHLNWMTIISDAMQGSCGDGDIQDNNGNAVGRFKAFGGLVMCTFSFPSKDSYVVRMPSNPFNTSPLFLSDGSQYWGVKAENIWTISFAIENAVDGYCTYWS